MGCDGGGAQPTDGQAKSSARALPTADGWLAASLDRPDRPCPAPQTTTHKPRTPAGRCGGVRPSFHESHHE